ncbi:hypothetical protein [Nocardioides panzhihuensis]|uniref:Uncharacterized protein n=1 Tax=Nocardioides panzhihuensis TaxID=860243 RepID=A0A7Z0IUV5_9ACTN|nr:hypothetical protein [Nocardioides panzhihuensis]NYI80375.1 hypothetical protein [Nocardioides panzhihuensis]
MPASRGWGWAAHLREGGTTPWTSWSEPAAPFMAAHLPGAEVLELLRRLNATGPVEPSRADALLRTSPPGRGRRDLPLLGDTETRTYGPPPVDPATLSSRELLRAASVLLAEDLLDTVEAVPVRRRRWWSRRPKESADDRQRFPYRLVGSPWLTLPIREELERQGRLPNGDGYTVYVLGGPLDEVAAGAWKFRTFTNRVNPWSIWIRDAQWRGWFGPRADLPRIARWWADRVGKDRVEIVTDPALLPGLLGVDSVPGPWEISAEANEVARVIGQVLCVRTDLEAQRKLLIDELRPRLEKLEPHIPGAREVGVPAESFDWVETQARAQRDALVQAGYALHGDPDRLLPSGTATQGPDERRALALALSLLAGRP